jgi:hypothetical protein
MSMDNIGKPIPYSRRQAAFDTARDFGLDSQGAFAAIEAMAIPLEKDRPHAAMEAGMRHVDLTGTYRLMAALLTPCTAENGGAGK